MFKFLEIQLPELLQMLHRVQISLRVPSFSYQILLIFNHLIWNYLIITLSKPKKS